MLLEAFAHAAARRRACGSRATVPTPPSLRAQYGSDDRDQLARSDRRRREVRPAARRVRVLRAVAARRVVRRRADRGDGGRHAGRRQRARRLPQRRDRRRRRAARRTGRRRPRSRPRCDACSTTRRSANRLRDAGRRSAPSSSRWPSSPIEYVAIYRELLAARRSATLTSGAQTGVTRTLPVHVDPPHHPRDPRDPGDRPDRRLQRADPAAQPDRERVVADRRAAEASPRPHPQPRRDGEGLRRPREGDARRRDQRTQRGDRSTADTPKPRRPRTTS